MAKFEVGIGVQRFDGKSRVCGNGIYFDEAISLWAAGINPCSYEYTLEILSSLERVLSGEIIEYEWGGGERTWLVSTKELTIATDNFAWQKEDVKTTVEIIEMLEKRKYLMEKLTKENIFQLLKISFEVIKKEPLSFRNNKNNYLYTYFDMLSKLKVSMILLETDLKIETQDFLDQIVFNNSFFKNSETQP